MRGATAALAGALLFFLGVLTASSEGSQVVPPSAIPLGVKVVGSPTASRTPARAESPGPAPASTPSTPERAPEPAAPPAESDPASATTTSAPSSAEPSSTTSTTTTSNSGPSSTTTSSGPPAGEESPAEGDSGGVEEVDGRVDCTDTGRGRDDSSCPPERDRRRGRD